MFTWRLGKGKPPLDLSKDLWKEYLALWEQWAELNPSKLAQLRALATPYGGVLSDMFATTPVNQAHALSVLLNR